MAPQFRAGLGVIGVQRAAAVGHEHEIAARRQDAGHRRLGEFDLPLLGAGDRIARVEMAIDLACRRLGDLEIGADVELHLRLGHRRRLSDGQRHAPFLTDLVVEASFRIVGTRIPAHAARNVRAQYAVDLALGEIAPTNQFAGLGIDGLHEIVVRDERPDVLDLGVGAVIDEDEPALVGMHHIVLAAAVDRDELARRAVEVPGVVRQFLMVEFQLAGVDVERDDGAGVEIVARACALGLVIGARPIIQRPRVGGAPPDGVGCAVERAGHPAAAAAHTPSVVAPRLLGFVAVAAGGVEFPLLLARGRVDREDRPLVGPFAALRADDDRALGVEGRAGKADGQLLAVDQLGFPNHFAGGGVEAEQAPVNRAHERLAFAKREAARVGRMRLARHQRVVEFRQERPLERARRAVEREGAAVGAGVEQDAVGDERHGLQASGRMTGDVAPGDLKILDVARVDLIQRAVIVAFVGTVIGQPIIRATGFDAGGVHRRRHDRASRHQAPDDHRQRAYTHAQAMFHCVFSPSNIALRVISKVTSQIDKFHSKPILAIHKM